jgi:hypothetical protein
MTDSRLQKLFPESLDSHQLIQELLQATRFREISWRKDTVSMQGYRGERHLTRWRDCRIEMTFYNSSLSSQNYVTLVITHPTSGVTLRLEYWPSDDPESDTDSIYVPWSEFDPLIDELWSINPPWK